MNRRNLLKMLMSLPVFTLLSGSRSGKLSTRTKKGISSSKSKNMEAVAYFQTFTADGGPGEPSNPQIAVLNIHREEIEVPCEVEHMGNGLIEVRMDRQDLEDVDAIRVCVTVDNIPVAAIRHAEHFDRSLALGANG